MLGRGAASLFAATQELSNYALVPTSSLLTLTKALPGDYVEALSLFSVPTQELHTSSASCGEMEYRRADV